MLIRTVDMMRSMTQIDPSIVRIQLFQTQVFLTAILCEFWLTILAILKNGVNIADKSNMSNRSSFLKPDFDGCKSGVFEDGEEELQNFLDGLDLSKESTKVDSEFLRMSWDTEGSSSRFGRHF